MTVVMVVVMTGMTDYQGAAEIAWSQKAGYIH